MIWTLSLNIIFILSFEPGEILYRKADFQLVEIFMSCEFHLWAHNTRNSSLKHTYNMITNLTSIVSTWTASSLVGTNINTRVVGIWMWRNNSLSRMGKTNAAVLPNMVKN